MSAEQLQIYSICLQLFLLQSRQRQRHRFCREQLRFLNCEPIQKPLSPIPRGKVGCSVRWKDISPATIQKKCWNRFLMTERTIRKTLGIPFSVPMEQGYWLSGMMCRSICICPMHMFRSRKQNWHRQYSLPDWRNDTAADSKKTKRCWAGLSELTEKFREILAKHWTGCRMMGQKLQKLLLCSH